MAWRRHPLQPPTAKTCPQRGTSSSSPLRSAPAPPGNVYVLPPAAGRAARPACRRLPEGPPNCRRRGNQGHGRRTAKSAGPLGTAQLLPMGAVYSFYCCPVGSIGNALRPDALAAAAQQGELPCRHSSRAGHGAEPQTLLRTTAWRWRCFAQSLHDKTHLALRAGRAPGRKPAQRTAWEEPLCLRGTERLSVLENCFKQQSKPPGETLCLDKSASLHQSHGITQSCAWTVPMQPRRERGNHRRKRSCCRCRLCGRRRAQATAAGGNNGDVSCRRGLNAGPSKAVWGFAFEPLCSLGGRTPHTQHSRGVRQPSSASPSAEAVGTARDPVPRRGEWQSPE